MKVLLSALVAAMLVSPALADTPACLTEAEVILSAPKGAKLVRKLTSDEVRTFVMNATVEDHIPFEDGVDGINIYSAPEATSYGESPFFTFKGECVVGFGLFKTESLGNLLNNKTL